MALEHWREQENTKAIIKTQILNYLYDDQTGLPISTYSEPDVKEKTEQVFVYLLESGDPLIHAA